MTQRSATPTSGKAPQSSTRSASPQRSDRAQTRARSDTKVWIIARQLQTEEKQAKRHSRLPRAQIRRPRRVSAPARASHMKFASLSSRFAPAENDSLVFCIGSSSPRSLCSAEARIRQRGEQIINAEVLMPNRAATTANQRERSSRHRSDAQADSQGGDRVRCGGRGRGGRQTTPQDRGQHRQQKESIRTTQRPDRANRGNWDASGLTKRRSRRRRPAREGSAAATESRPPMHRIETRNVRNEPWE
jgi:hypothetical protein